MDEPITYPYHNGFIRISGIRLVGVPGHLYRHFVLA